MQKIEYNRNDETENRNDRTDNVQHQENTEIKQIICKKFFHFKIKGLSGTLYLPISMKHHQLAHTYLVFDIMYLQVHVTVKSCNAIL